MTPYPYPLFFMTLSFGMISFTVKKNLKKEAKSKKYFQKNKYFKIQNK